METQGLSASDLMVSPVYTVRAEERVFDVVRELMARGASGAPVVDDDHRVVGMCSEKDCIRALLRAIDGLPSSLVGDVMCTELTTVAPDTHLLTLAHLFLHNPIRRIPVVTDGGTLLGVVGRSDLLRAAANVFEIAPSRDSAVLYLSALDRGPPDGVQSRMTGTPPIARRR